MTYLQECEIAEFVSGDQVYFKGMVYVVRDSRYSHDLCAYEYNIGLGGQWIEESRLGKMYEEEYSSISYEPGTELE